jgi:cytochrome c553
MKRFVIALPWLVATVAFAQEKPRQLGLCSACHQDQGCSRTAGTPHLAGQDREYLAKAIRDYRDKSRHHAAMNAIAAGLLDRDVTALAGWYSAQKACSPP